MPMPLRLMTQTFFSPSTPSGPSSTATATTPRTDWISPVGTGSSVGKATKWSVVSDKISALAIDGRRWIDVIARLGKMLCRCRRVYGSCASSDRRKGQADRAVSAGRRAGTAASRTEPAGSYVYQST